MSETSDYKKKPAGTPERARVQPFTELLAPVAATTKSESWNGIKLYVFEPKTNTVLLDIGGDSAHDPASLAKLAFFYVVQTAIRDEVIKPHDTLKVPDFSYTMRKNKSVTTQKLQAAYLKEGHALPVSELIDAMMVKSDNGAAQMLAAALEKKLEKSPIDLMNNLGLKSSRFSNVGGLPADQDPDNTKPNEAKVTTARDMATLIQRVQKEFPEAMATYMTKAEVTYDKKTHKANHFLLADNSALKLPEGYSVAAKTGFVNASGHNIATIITAPDGNELVAVVLGSKRRWSIKEVKQLGIMSDAAINQDIVENSVRGNRVRDALVQQLAKHYLGEHNRAITLTAPSKEEVNIPATDAYKKLPAAVLKEVEACGQKIETSDCQKSEGAAVESTRLIKPVLTR